MEIPPLNRLWKSFWIKAYKISIGFLKLMFKAEKNIKNNSFDFWSSSLIKSFQNCPFIKIIAY